MGIDNDKQLHLKGRYSPDSNYMNNIAYKKRQIHSLRENYPLLPRRSMELFFIDMVKSKGLLTQ